MPQSGAPWARFALISAENPAKSDHIYFSRPLHRIGRSAERCDVVLDLQYISSVHCVVGLEGRTEDGVPIVRLEDKSRNGIWVNGDRVGKGNWARLESGFTVHFTRPGLKASGVEPRIYKFEVLQLEVEAKPEAVSVTQELNPSALGSPQSARPLGAGGPAKKKRRRSVEQLDETVPEDLRGSEIKDLARKLDEAQRHIAALTESAAEHSARHERVMEKAKAERAKLATNVEVLAAERQQLSTKAEELASKLDAAGVENEKQLKTLKQQLNERDSELDALKKECDEAKRALEEMEAALNDRSKQFTALKAEKADLMKRLAASEKPAEDAHSTTDSGKESDKQAAVDERQLRQEVEIAALRQELDASRLRVSELEDQVKRSSVATPAPAPNAAAAASTSQHLRSSDEVIARLQQQLAAARGFFKQIQALGMEGEAALERVDEVIDSSVAADCSTSELGRDEGSAPPATVDIATATTAVVSEEPKDGHGPVETRAAGDATKVKLENEASAAVEDMEVEGPNDDAHEEEAADTEPTQATKAPDSQRELPDKAEAGADGHRSDPGSDKSPGSKSTTLGSADADTE